MQPDRRDLPVKLGLPAHKGLSVQPGPSVLKDLPVKLGLQALRAPLVRPALPVLKDLPVKPAPSVLRALPVACWALQISMR